MKAKVDKYEVFGKRRSYEILMFPNYQNMHVYDEYPREDTYRIDGDKEVVSALAAAVAILAEDPSKVIYFPGKKGGFGTGYEFNYHLVMARPELQFRRSEWYRLKPQLNKKHWKGKYVFSYHPGKLLDYYKQLKSDLRWKGWEKEDYKKWVEEVLGDTVFWILPRNFCYQAHAYLLDDLKDLQEKDFDVQGGYVGYLLSEGWMQSFIERIDRSLGEEPLSESSIYKEEESGFRIDSCFCITKKPYFKVYKGSWKQDKYLKKASMCRIQFYQSEYVNGVGSNWGLDDTEKKKLIRILKEENVHCPGMTNWQVLLREYRYQEEKRSRVIGVPDSTPMPDYMQLQEKNDEQMV